MLKYFFFLLLMSFLVFSQLNGQPVKHEPQDLWSYGVNGYYGGLFKMHSHDPLFQLSNLHGFELLAKKTFVGKERWEALYNYPELDLNLSYYNYGIPQIFGQAYAGYTSLNFGLLNRTDHRVRLATGAGVVYNNKIYHVDQNHDNRAISRHWNFGLRINLSYERRLTDKTWLSTGLAFRHVSNGRLKIPNNGLNAPMVGFGLRYVPQGAYRFIKRDSAMDYDKKVHLHLAYARGWKNVMGYDPVLNHVNLLSVYLSRKISPINALLLGLDGYYDTSAYHEYWMMTSRRPPEDMEFDHHMAAVTIGNIFYLGQFELLFQFARFIYLPIKFYSNYYQRYAIQYRIIPHVFGRVGLKAYRGKADLLEFGVGVSL
ncbi:MAG: acyloxyacyl hydrolase [Candidatus Cyclobacteriaceae bacterium M3_2C_046]